MLILKSIGAFFVRIWRWIKETAWVQPLLIVGAVFAVIFSIPSLTNLVDSWAGSGDGTFYERYIQTLEGEVLHEEDGETLTAADRMTADLAAAIANPDDQDAVSKVTSTYGEKFFLLYVGNECTACLDDEGGFQTLSSDWKKNFHPSDDADLRLYTIDSDQTSTNDEEYSNRDWNTAFRRYLMNYADSFFQPLSDLLYETNYHYNADISDETYQYFGDAAITGENTFTVPVTILFDFSAEALEEGRIVEGVLTSLTGSTNIEKANFLTNMWNHLDDDRQNPFSAGYWTSSNA